MKPKSLLALSFCLLIALAIAAAAQSKHPNLTGTWKMNAEKSKFEQGGPSAITIKIDHQDTALSEMLSVTTPNGDSTVEAKYTIDGKETAQEVMGRQAQTAAKWEGDALAINWKADDGSFNRTITLSPDGKTMTLIVKQTHDGASTTDTLVFEKQDAKK